MAGRLFVGRCVACGSHYEAWSDVDNECCGVPLSMGHAAPRDPGELRRMQERQARRRAIYADATNIYLSKQAVRTGALIAMAGQAVGALAWLLVHGQPGAVNVIQLTLGVIAGWALAGSPRPSLPVRPYAVLRECTDEFGYVDWDRYDEELSYRYKLKQRPDRCKPSGEPPRGKPAPTHVVAVGGHLVPSCPPERAGFIGFVPDTGGVRSLRGEELRLGSLVRITTGMRNGEWASVVGFAPNGGVRVRPVKDRDRVVSYAYTSLEVEWVSSHGEPSAASPEVGQIAEEIRMGALAADMLPFSDAQVRALGVYPQLPTDGSSE